MSQYECEVQLADDRIAVRGGFGSSPFDIDLEGDLALLGAGEHDEFVSEWVLSEPGAVEGLCDLISQVISGHDLGGARSRLGYGLLTGYTSYVRRPPETP